MKLKKELNKLKGLPLGSGVKDQMPVVNATKSKQKSALTLYFLLQIFVLIFVPRTEAEQPTSEGSPAYMRKPNSPRCRNKKIHILLLYSARTFLPFYTGDSDKTYKRFRPYPRALRDKTT